jgi:hypothetical protein
MVNRFLFLVLPMVGVVSSAVTRRNEQQPACTATLDGILPASTPSDFEFSGTVKRYYIAAEGTEWDYAPTGWDNWLGVSVNNTLYKRYSQGNGYQKGSFRAVCPSTIRGIHQLRHKMAEGILSRLYRLQLHRAHCSTGNPRFTWTNNSG